jgi:hypothetical protein
MSRSQPQVVTSKENIRVLDDLRHSALCTCVCVCVCVCVRAWVRKPCLPVASKDSCSPPNAVPDILIKPTAKTQACMDQIIIVSTSPVLMRSHKYAPPACHPQSIRFHRNKAFHSFMLAQGDTPVQSRAERENMKWQLMRIGDGTKWKT